MQASSRGKSPTGRRPVYSTGTGKALLIAGLVLCPCTVVADTARLQAERFKNLGVAYLEENRPAEAERAFRRVIELAGDEALGYANLGIAYLRLGELERAVSQLEQARRLAPNNTDVLLLGAEAQFAAGHWQAVINTSRQVLDIDARNAMARYYIYRAARAQPDSERAQDIAAAQLEQLHRHWPRNLVVLLRYARKLTEQRAWDQIARQLKSIAPAMTDVPQAEAMRQQALEAVVAQDPDQVRYALVALENVLLPTSRFRQDLQQLQPPVAGLPLLQFSPAFRAALEADRPPRIELAFVLAPPPTVPDAGAPASCVTRASLDFADVDQDGREQWLVACGNDENGRVQLWQRDSEGWRDGLAGIGAPAATQARFVDFDDDGRFEILAAGPGGIYLLRRDDQGAWEDAPLFQDSNPPGAIALEILDIDNEGDLDIAVAARDRFLLWQNRPDGVFSDIASRAGLSAIGGGARRLRATDYDDDLDTDLIVITAEGKLQLWDNRRHATFANKACGLLETPCRALFTGDLDNDGFEDLAAITDTGRLLVQYNREGVFAPPLPLPLKELRATAVVGLDADNDGWLDLAVTGTLGKEPAAMLLRNRGEACWDELLLPSPAAVCRTLNAWDYDRDGDLDLVAVDCAGRVVAWRNDGGNAHHFLRVRLQGSQVAGSKNNLHGIGSKIEVKAGLLYGMRYARGPVTHFGLGNHPQADLLRVVWSNGVPQNRFRPAADQTIREVQVLKGSCPYLYCWNGSEFVFVTDTLAGAPLGLQVAEGVLAPAHSRELLTIPRDKIAPCDGQYVFQYTSELWETVYLDEVALWAVDHPQEMEVFTDQRFRPPPYQPPEPIVTRRRRPPHRVEDTRGHDVTAALLEFDHRYPERLRPTRYQGLVESHCLTLDFGDVTTMRDPLLILGCWIFWTDTSINVAVSQGEHSPAPPTAVEVWNRDSGWQPLSEPFGLPNGKDKWAVVDVADHLDRHQARIRLRSCSQIYWDQAFLAERDTETPRRITRLPVAAADLHWGGFNELYRPAEDGPHLYRYGRKTHIPVWMDMSGWATRYGDVTELLRSADDRFVIFTAGDEITLRFQAAALPELPTDWQRSFLFYSDGWEKDSDRNTVMGETVEPLPFHGMSAYPYPAGETYPQGAAHEEYRRRYNTRWIGPEAFRNFVKDFEGTTPPCLPWEHEPGVRGDHDS